MRLPIVKSLHIESFSGTGINAADFFNKNAVIGEYPDGRIYSEQRPSIDIFDDASVSSLAEKGRGVYYWTKASDRYIVVDDKVYKGNTASVAIHTFAAGGTEKVYFIDMVNYLVILDPENNKGYSIHSGATSTVVQITDVNFPGQASNSDPLLPGGVFLDGRAYVGGESGAIYGSDSNTPITWDPLNKISAERESDGGVYVDKHKDHVVMFGERTIELFYNNKNPTGSPLSRRRDIFHNTGMLEGDAAWREGDDIYFVGVYPSGPLQVSRLSEMELESISTPEVESYITNARLVEDSLLVASGFTAGQRSYYIITFYRLVGGVVTPSITLNFDGVAWGVFETDITGLTKFPLVGWTIRSGSTARSGEGIMSNGDLITINDNFVPVDTILATDYILDSYVASGYYTSTDSAGTNIEMVVRTGPFDGDTNKWKFAHNMEIVGDLTPTAGDDTVRWAEGNSLTFNTGRTIDASVKQKASALGRFVRRNHEIVVNRPEQRRIEAIELEYTEGGH